MLLTLYSSWAGSLLFVPRSSVDLGPLGAFSVQFQRQQKAMGYGTWNMLVAERLKERDDQSQEERL